MSGTGAREWVSFEDPHEDRTWLFDVAFLLSNWTCIYGQGCQGVLTGPAPEMEQGCCSYGAVFTDEADRARVEAAARELGPEDWQFRDEAQRRGGPVRSTPTGSGFATRLVGDACIFLNRPDFPGGAGCALHRGAMAVGRKPLEWKPDVCWQLPLVRSDSVADSGHVTSTVRSWERMDWGIGGGLFHWWCTDAPDAFVGSRPAYEELHDELEAMVGAEMYTRLVNYLVRRRAGKAFNRPRWRIGSAQSSSGATPSSSSSDS
jgi:hypothetical protein